MERGYEAEEVIPFQMSVVLDKEEWRTVYAARTVRGEERLTILHQPGKPPAYSHTLPRGEALSLPAGRGTNSFANTDFALADLGLEFLHWPRQLLLTREMRKGRGCDVLESRPATVGSYSRVVSWIDQESGGILLAHAYDATGKRLKEFEVHLPKRVAGEWKLQELEVRNRVTKSSTRLRFVYDPR